MAKGWTEERRKAQAEMIRKHKPWEKSTGPKTEKGRKESSMNAYKHGRLSAEMTLFQEALRANRDFLKMVHKLALAEKEKSCRTNELIKEPLKSK